METRIDVVKRFVELHKEDDILNWQPVGADDDQKYLRVYDKLRMGTYGEVRDNGVYNDDGEEVEPPTSFEIEIRTFESKSGNPYIFEWEESPPSGFKF